MRVALLGLGLIGGSIARALRASGAGDWTLTAWTPGGAGPRAALAAGVVDQAPTRAADAVAGADLVVLAGPAMACLGLLDELGGALRAALATDAVVTDVASTKGAMVERAAGLGLRFVGGHPMAGRETSGYGAADPDLFRDRPWVVVPSGDEPAATRVEALARACGARPIRLGAAEHDSLVAAVSHLPLVLSAALVEAVAGAPGAPAADWEPAARLAASGWEGMTRLARGDVEMGTGIAVTNGPRVAARLRDLRAVIDAWIALLEDPAGPDAAAIRERLAAARSRLEA